jgi:hypothetical protein
MMRLLALAAVVLAALAPARALAGAAWGPSQVTLAKLPDGSFQYLVDGQSQVFIGMGYDAIYRYLPDEQRAAMYRRDFGILRDAGVNTITGWDADKGYEQDKFDELTLAIADEYGLGVVMPLNLPPDGDYRNETFVQALLDQARQKLDRFHDFHALRMWGVGNEVLWEMQPEMHPDFLHAYLRIADLFHELDPNHPVIYREAEDVYMPELISALRDSGDIRPWLLFGLNVYNKDVRPLLRRWPSYGLDRPVLVSEFGAEADSPDGRAVAYLDMWRGIRCYPSFVLGGAPYVWTTEGPEPTDKIWGLMDGNAWPVDGTFATLSSVWLNEPAAPAPDCDGAPMSLPERPQTISRPRPPAPAPVAEAAIVKAPLVVSAPAPGPPPPPSPSPKPAVKPALSPASSPKPAASAAPAPVRVPTVTVPKITISRCTLQHKRCR